VVRNVLGTTIAGNRISITTRFAVWYYDRWKHIVISALFKRLYYFRISSQLWLKTGGPCEHLSLVVDQWCAHGVVTSSTSAVCAGCRMIQTQQQRHSAGCRMMQTPQQRHRHAVCSVPSAVHFAQRARNGALQSRDAEVLADLHSWIVCAGHWALLLAPTIFWCDARYWKGGLGRRCFDRSAIWHGALRDAWMWTANFVCARVSCFSITYRNLGSLRDVTKAIIRVALWVFEPSTCRSCVGCLQLCTVQERKWPAN
jgi:hypothetical protein